MRLLARFTAAFAVLFLFLLAKDCASALSGETSCVVELSVSSMPSRLEYTAFSKFDTAGLVLTARYESGECEEVLGDAVNIHYRRADHLLYGDGGVTLEYMGAQVYLPLTVKRCEYDLSGFFFESQVLTFNGEYQSITPTGQIPVGLDGIPLEYEIYSPKRDAGSYTVSLVFSTESSQYQTPMPLKATLHILPREIELLWSDEPLFYTGEPKAPAARVSDDTLGVEITVLGEKCEAGEGYLATAISRSDNYVIKNPYKIFSIEKASYDMSGAFWVGEGFVYDGCEKRVYLSNLPSGVSVKEYISAVATGAGEYEAKALFDYDSENYHEPKVAAYSWQILPASYDMSGVRFYDSEFVYDGNEHFPTLSGVMPTGYDGSQPTYTFSRGATHVSDGVVTVEITFASGSENYLAPSPILATVLITPKRISVRWEVGDFVYDGSPKVPVAKSDECEISVSGAKTSAGEYIAYASALCSDFLLRNPECPYRIKKAKNAPVGEIEIFDIYSSGIPDPICEMLHGAASFSYFSDAECTQKLTLPFSVGMVYAKAFVPESENYLAFESEPISFFVMEVLPIGIELEGSLGTFSAFEKLSSSSASVYLLYNDTTRAPLLFSDIFVEYQNGESFRFGDTYVTLRYGGFMLECLVEISRADYDMSAARWSDGSFIYDGEEKAIFLTGLPSGVSVAYYENNRKIAAGEYFVIARLSYDAENYNPPIVPDGRLVIARQKVKIPPPIHREYTAEPHAPEVDSELYYLTDFPYIQKAGTYLLSLALVDSQNYEWEGALDDTAELKYFVLPYKIELVLPSVTLYLFEKLPPNEIRTLKSELDGSSVELILITEKSGVVAKSSDPNYSVEIIGGEVVQKLIPSPAFMRIFAQILLLVLLVALLIFLIYRYGRRVLNRICKRKTAPVRLSSIATDRDAALFEKSTHTSEEQSAAAPLIENKIEKTILGMDEARADELISDDMAKGLLRREDKSIKTAGRRKSVINVDTLSSSFSSGDSVDVNLLKKKSLVPYDTGYIKVLARGVIDKPLRIYANDFSLSAVKMIALTGGEAIKCDTLKLSARQKRKGS